MKSIALSLNVFLIACVSCSAQESAPSSINVTITGKTEGAYNIGASVRPTANSRRPKPLLSNDVAQSLKDDQGNSSDTSNKKTQSEPTASSGLTSSLMQKALDESHHQTQGSSGSSGSGMSAKDFEKNLLGDFQMATATDEDIYNYLSGLGSHMKDYMQAAAESELPILEVQNVINNVQKALQDEARRRQNDELEKRIAEAFGALQPETVSEIERAIKESPEPPKPAIDTSAPLDDQRRQAVDNDDYNHLASLARQETGGNLRKERDHFAEAMNAAANVAGSENATPAQREAARQFAQNLANYFHNLGGRTQDDPLFTDSCNVLSATCDNIAHWKEPPW